jgi:hypothetical protein
MHSKTVAAALLAAAPLFAATPELLAPGPTELALHLQRTESRATEATAISHALTSLHNAWGARLATVGAGDVCADVQALADVARTRAFGAAFRDAAQSARAEARRLRLVAASPTVAGLLGSDKRTAVDAALQNVDQLGAAYLEAAAWQTRFVEGTVARCAGAPRLSERPGAPDPVLSRGASERRRAVIGIGGGTLCPDGVPADGRVAVLVSTSACYGVLDCSCDPAPIEPGAVIGPPDAPAAGLPPDDPLPR